ncbi:MAG: SpoIIE family protein phosphatase [Thermoanaerobaculia bacterium]|jgi:sigma-B regulation protein RsbU (phosphoserine phosphatase)
MSLPFEPAERRKIGINRRLTGSWMQLTATLFDELQAIEKIAPRAASASRRRAETIREVLSRHLPYSRIGVYFDDSQRGELVLAAAIGSGLPDALERLCVVREPGSVLQQCDPPADYLVPLASSKEVFGALVLGGGSAQALDENGRSSLRALGAYLSALLAASRLATEVRDGDFQMRLQMWELESLYDIGLSIASMLDMGQLGDEILVRTMSLVNARRAALYLRQGTRFALHQALGGARAQFLDDELSPDAVKTLLDAGEPVAFEKGADCIFPGCETLVAMPIRSSNGEVIGVLAAADREFRDGSVGPFEDGELRLLHRFANQVSIALQNARLHRDALDKQAIERDLELAGSIQNNILPRTLPTTEGYEIAVLHNPARQLGGDYHTFFERDGVISACVADVSGKSVPAAILVSALHAALQLLFHERRPLGEIAEELNRHIHRWSSESKFITFIIATIDRKAEEIRYVNAGHNPAFIVLDGKVETLHSHGLPIGILGASRYEAQTRPFPAGSLLALYSDGITEANNVAEDEFGPVRLTDILTANETKSCAAIRDLIRDEVREFAGEAPQYDDQTVVLVRTS